MLRRVVAAMIVVAMVACSTPRHPVEQAGVTFVLVRHAEKGVEDEKDPALSGAGMQRAVALAARLADEPLVAAYATAYRRTQQTARPAAAGHGIAVTTYDARLPARALADQLRASHPRGTVLVVGHSNTVPEIVAALSGQAVEAMADDRFDLIYSVHVLPDGNATLVQESY